ncbi:MAG: hypothetical protein JSR91_02525 [Proteobacteria bacterium]|nr:hypothetical protein [Pseudomonadota bacterium]
MLLRARSFAERGHDVTLVGLTSGPGSRRAAQLGKGNLTEVRLRARPVPRSSLLRRLAWTLWTNMRLLAAVFGPMRCADGILFTGSPPFLVHLLAPFKPLWRGRLIYRITDFHPECLIAAREHHPSRTLQALLWLTNVWRHRVDGFEVLGEDQFGRLRATGIARERIALVRDGSPVVFDDNVASASIPRELAGHCVLLYSGNYGIAHEVETVAEGYRLHCQRGSGRVRLWLSASGAGAEALAARFAGDELPFYRSSPVPLDRLAGLLRAPDAHLITLKDRFVGYVMPSKVYACLESRRPLLFVGSDQSDIDQLARRSGLSYRRISCGDAPGFAEALEEVADLALKKS